MSAGSYRQDSQRQNGRGSSPKAASFLREGQIVRSDEMTTENVHTESDTRKRILVIAERLFREIGYRKITVSDIAKALHMSPANVYRFFESKKAIHEDVVRHLMGEVEAEAETIVRKPAPATTRLRELMLAIRQSNAERCLADTKLHEMVKFAMQENWDACNAHITHITGLIGRIIADGVASGEFAASDVELAAKCATTAMSSFLHPQMITDCASKSGPTINQQIEFVLAALKPQNERTGDEL